MSLVRALAWNTGVQMIGKVASTALGVVIVGLLTRYLGQEGFGAYATATAFLQVFTLVLDLGLNVTFVALLGEHADDPTYERRCSSALFTLRLISGLAITVLAPAIGWLSPYPSSIKWAILALTGSLLFPSLTQMVTGVQQRHLKMHIAATGEVLGRITLLAGILFAKYLGVGLVPIMWFVSLGGFVNFAWNLFFTRAYGSFAWNWDPKFWKIALTRSWPIGVSILFNLIYFKADTLILSFTRSQAEVGIYSAAYRVLEILITIPFMYAGLVLPLLSRARQTRDNARFAFLMSHSTDAMLLLALPMVAGTVILGPRIMVLIAGAQFIASGSVLKLLIISTGIIYLNVVFAHGVVALQAQRKMLPIYIATALVTLAGYLLFIPRYGMWAAAWLTLFSEICVTSGSYLISRSFVRYAPHLKPAMAGCVASILMSIVVWMLRASWLPIPLSAGALVYVVFVFLLGGVSKKTLQELLPPKNTQPLETPMV